MGVDKLKYLGLKVAATTSKGQSEPAPTQCTMHWMHVFDSAVDEPQVRVTIWFHLGNPIL
jgi:hypothetical protein